MDPTATLKLLDDAIDAGDREAVVEHAKNLRDWLNKDGAPPVVASKRDWRYGLSVRQFIGHLRTVIRIATKLDNGDR